MRLCNDETCVDFQRNITYEWSKSKQSWQNFWSANHHRFECQQCQEERRRRKRVIGCQEYGGLSTDEATKLLESKTFTSSVYITEYNQPVCLYAQVRAQMFARHHKQQLFWVQAEDIPPAMHFAEHSSSELQNLKKMVVAVLSCSEDTRNSITFAMCSEHALPTDEFNQ